MGGGRDGRGFDRVGARLAVRSGESDPDRTWREELGRHGRPRGQGRADGCRRQRASLSPPATNYMRAGKLLLFRRAASSRRPRRSSPSIRRRCAGLARGPFERLYPQIERVDVPYEGTALAAYFMKAPGGFRPGAGRRAVQRHGQLQGDERRLRPGLGVRQARQSTRWRSTGRGRGESLRLRKWVTAGRITKGRRRPRLMTCVAARGDVDPAKVAVMGYSFGGLSRAAHRRFRAPLCRLPLPSGRHALGPAQLAERRSRERLAADPKTQPRRRNFPVPAG